MTDFSDTSRNAVVFGIKLYGTGVRYLLVNTYTVRTTAGAFLNLEEEVRKDSVRQLENEMDYLRRTLDEFDQLDIVAHSRYGDPVGAVNRLQLAHPTMEVVVMGNQGSSGIATVLIGSVTSSVIRNCTAPVLVVPQGSKYEGMKSIVLATDLQKNRNEGLFDPLIYIAQKYRSKVNILNVVHPDEIKEDEMVVEKLEQLNQIPGLEDLDKTYVLREDEDVDYAIKDFCQNNDIQLVTVVSRHNRFVHRIFHKSLSQKLLYEGVHPMLILEDSFNQD